MTAVSPLASLKATRAVLDKYGLAAKHSLGQNFLVNDGVVGRIVQLSGVCEADTVLEVGPGIGTLTSALLPRAGHVVAVERDADLVPVLQDTCAPWWDKLTLLNRDAVGLAPADLAAAYPAAAPNKLIANLPYVVATALVLDYFRDLPNLESATVMVQREVAQRMMAQPGTKDYGAYTVKLNLRAAATGSFTVAPANFFPAPKVTSTVIRLDRVAPALPDGGVLTPAILDAADTLADAAFAQRRKTIANSFKAYFGGRGAAGAAALANLDTLLAAGGIEPTRRGETLTQAEFLRLAQLFEKSQN